MQLLRADSVEAVVEHLSEIGAAAQIVAGGTDIVIQMFRDETKPEVLIPIDRIGELSICASGEKVEIGALVTHATVAQALSTVAPALAEAAGVVGGWQTQAVGTIVGNVCNASPAADTVPALLLHDAQVALRSAGGKRTVSLESFLLGRRTTDRRPDEMVTGLWFAAPPASAGETYLKVGRRGAMEVAIVGYAMMLAFDGDDAVADARIAVNAVSEVPMRVRAAEEMLIGRRLSGDVAGDVSSSIAAAISPINDLRASASYRHNLIPGLTRRALRVCAERAGIACDLGEGAA